MKSELDPICHCFSAYVTTYCLSYVPVAEVKSLLSQ